MSAVVEGSSSGRGDKVGEQDPCVLGGSMEEMVLYG